MKAYFSHDEGARNDPKLVRVLMRLGQAGKGVYWDLVEMLHEQGGYLPLSDLESMAFGLRTDLALLTSLLNDFGLFSQDAERFWSESALERLQMRNAKAEARAAAGAKGGKAKAEREAAAKALLEQSHSNASKDSSIASEIPSNATALPAETLASKEKERKEKESKPLPSVEEAASAAPTPEKKIEVEPTSENPDAGLRTPGGAADVGTQVELAARPAKLRASRGGKQLMADTPLADFGTFAAAWEAAAAANPDTYAPYAGVNLKHYHGALLDWSTANGQKKADWLATIRGSIRRAHDESRMRKLGTTTNPQQHAVTRPSYSNATSAAAARLQTPQPDATKPNPWGIPGRGPAPTGPTGIGSGH